MVARNNSGSDGVGTFEDPPVGHAELEAAHVLAETAVDVMILAVYVGGDHAAEGDELGAGRDGHEPAAAEEHAVQLSSDTPASARSSPEAGSKLSSRSASVVSATGKSPRAGSDESP